MKTADSATDEALLEFIGARLARVRLSHNLTQQEVAEQAGLGVRTVQRLEAGAAATQLSGFIRICRVLGLADSLEQLVPEPPVSPIVQLKLQGRKRQRATGTRSSEAPPAKVQWTWGETE